MASLGGKCVFASDIDKECQRAYKQNYGIDVVGDITKVSADDIEPFNVLCAGFPCQAFSNAGKQLGFNDPTRGTLFFDVMRIARYQEIYTYYIHWNGTGVENQYESDIDLG